ncbi:hypothetical protein PHYSODRAFT_553851 [Phytophthora sojae]|uniref:Uncharacterized protein n=1 Tax=Phytophthora sojae (strain P6497) TaxID=1094619 RepID=G4YP80_PHYSP|nr:hypothetical protein PHYSODRAFT_553851 [Phytophthora sojae]EGZ27214.1 hypothetical protein PHYSODRAFT_553851 [Phytophthora sojae]|eukprot:XP_009514489.1 hypothetical protein PHYSODRAFT_553851 [Phytophthora sojae]
MSGRVIVALFFVALPAVANAAECSTKRCTLACAPGEICVLETVTCIRAPCPPIQTCCVPAEPVCTKKCPKNEKCQIDSADNSQYCLSPCATVRCMSGYTCQVEQVQCIRAPCPPVAVCKPEPVKKGYGLRALNEQE